MYGFCGILFKTTSIDREWAFSVVKNYILKGNYNAGMIRLSIQIFIAALDELPVSTMDADALKAAKELRALVENWRPEATGKAKNLFHADHVSALAKINFKDLCTTVRDAPTLLNELYETHGGDATKLGVMKLAALIKSQKGKIEGRATADRMAEFGRLQDTLSEGREADLKAIAAKAPAVTARPGKVPKKRRRKRKKGDDSSSSESSECSEDEDGNEEDDPSMPSDVAALQSRVYTDASTEKEEDWAVLRVGYDREFGIFVAFIYRLSAGVPSTPHELDWIPAEELMHAPWAIEWRDSEPGHVDDENGEVTADGMEDEEDVGDADDRFALLRPVSRTARTAFWGTTT
jgi:hypothetical protein